MVLQLKPVPKKMGELKQSWNPSTTLVSFKLETDLEILESKALGAISKYGVDLVVANELKTRRNKVIIYHKDGRKVPLEVAEPVILDQISQPIIDHISNELGFIPTKEEDIKTEEPTSSSAPISRQELYVTNIDFDTSSDDLKEFFEKIGKISKCKLIFNSYGQSKGKAFISYEDLDNHDKAI